MRALPIYREPPTSPVQVAEPRVVDTSCELCDLQAHVPAGSRCVGAEGEPGGLLVVDSHADRAAQSSRRPFAGQSAGLLRNLVRKHWKGPVALDVALRCSTGSAPLKLDKLVKPIAACRGYLHQTLREVRPTRIIASGAHAILSLSGRRLPPFEVRRGFTWLHLEHGPVPVFFVCSPLAAARNRFVRQWFEDDLTWALTTEPPVGPHRTPGGDYPEDGGLAYLVTTVEEAHHAIGTVRASGVGAVDCEWAGRPYDRDHRMLSVSLTPAPRPLDDGTPDLDDPRADVGFVWTTTALETPAVLAPLLDYLRDPTAPKAGSYFKADMVGIHSAWKVWPRGIVMDVRLARRLMDTEASGELEVMAELVGRGGMKDELDDALRSAVASLKRAAKKNGGAVPLLALPPNLRPEHAQRLIDGAPAKRYGYAAVPPELLFAYNAGDTVVTSKLAALLAHGLSRRDAGLQNVWKKVVLPAGDTFARIESWGIAANRQAIEAFGKYLTLRLTDLRKRLARFVPDTFEPANDNHVRAYLFDPPPAGLGLEPLSSTPTGLAKADADTLEAYAEDHPSIQLLAEWRKLNKLKSTYADGTDGDGGLLQHVRDDGRIHPTIHPDGADTGRTSSSAPNLQNIPSMETSDEGEKARATMLRNCFTASPPGRDGLRWWLVEFDYSQIELRVAADLSGDDGMLEIFRSGQDYHRRSAQMLSRDVWGIAPEAVNDDHRREIKPVNFQLLYDDDPFSIAFNLSVKTGKKWSPKKVARIKDAIFGTFPELARFIRECVKHANTRGTMRTWWDGLDGRERSLWRIADVDERAAKTARRGAWNGPIQGTANEYLVDAAGRTVAWFLDDGLPAKLPMTIHDSMLTDVREDVLLEVVQTVPAIMASARTKNGVPLVADFKVGPAWGSMTKCKGVDDVRALLRAT